MHTPGHRWRAAAVALLLLASSAGAAGLEGSSTTLFDSRPYARDGKAYVEAPLYEQFSLFTPAVQVGPADDVRVVLRAWGRGGLGDAIFGDRVTSDIDVAYVEGAFAGKRVSVRLGRQFLSDGAARGLQLDGLSSIGDRAHRNTQPHPPRDRPLSSRVALPRVHGARPLTMCRRTIS
jgi:hypothetical protein